MAGPGNSGTGAIYYTVMKGKCVRRVRSLEDHPEAKFRLNKNNKEVYEVYHDFIEGTLVDVKTNKYEYQPGKFQVNIQAHIDADGQIYILQTKMLDSYGVDFISRFVNGVKFGDNVKLQPYDIERDDKPGKFNRGVSIRVDGQKIDRYWGAPDSGKPVLPRWVDTGVTDREGNKVWDTKEWEAAIVGKLVEHHKRASANFLDAASDYGKTQAAKSNEKTDSSDITYVPFDEEQAPPQQAAPQQQQGFSSDPTDLPF